MRTTTKQDTEFIEEVIDSGTFLEKAITWIGNNLNPEQVFDEKQLQQWAVSNGFVEE